MKITSKGQVTIPQKIREELGLLPDTEVDFVVEGSAVRLVKARGRKEPSRRVRLLRGLRGSASSRLSTEEIMALTRGRR